MGAPVAVASAHSMPDVGSDANHPYVVSRMTKGKRMLWYCLKVIQQPERARACGSGPKSSADRRPVDPPPVVELRIYEGDTWDRAQSKDITFLYNANFFLFATLEHARVMAHGRVQTPAANSPPILTGMPVSGMAYLDRPQEAGYFLFPDLSVRHEGRYRLTFNLYEETKEDDDKDPDSPENKPVVPGVNSATGGSFDFRMEVKSQDFVVYSAKKFPGLTESTQLSRVVAEQGCRVRIRRDVRMRRRDGKGNGDYDNSNSNNGSNNNAEDEYARRARRTATPDARPDAYRARSLSGSVERTPYSADSQRRPSIADYPPQFPSQAAASQGHLHFLGGNSSSQYPGQSQGFAQPQPPSVPASPVYPPSQGAGYPSQSSYPPPPPQPTYTPERPPAQKYAPINPAPRRESVPEYRNPAGTITLPPITIPALPPLSQQTGHGSMLMPKPPTSHTLPPLQMDHSSVPGRLTLPTPSPTFIAPRPPQYSVPPIYTPRPLAQYAGTKRAHDETFRHDTHERYQDGTRETASAQDKSAPMIYTRADGRQQCREAPIEYSGE